MEEIKKTFLEEFEGAEEQLEKNRYKNAAILSSKALFALCDFLIHSKLKKLPKNHHERFRILEEYFPDVYLIVDNVFNHYTDAYSKPILKETCELIKNGIQKIVRNKELPEEIKKIVG
ncbi:hypothetical protein HON71_04250 [Candidatus Woesearchaeota archaeon]|jgi:hypothetical protein|nr:hypothetical protein [Candidatus Woesearchaeota archaeon]MBT5343012.1 hypothetical protein [Candidatus Woesearchaeota archaeon]